MISERFLSGICTCRLNGWLAMLFLLLATSGCATRDHRLLAETIAPAPAAQLSAVHRIFVATSRSRTQQPGVVFSGERTADAAFAFVDISVPSVHTPGEIERSPSPEVADPARYFAARRVGLYDGDDSFRNALRADIAARGGRALVFVHGYNTSFDEAVYRITQIVHDAGYLGAPILFTWPSSARIIDYIYDNNSATAARDMLEATLRLVAAAGASRIDIVSHSMGAWVTMEALRQLALTGQKELGGTLGDVVLAAPDIDVDVFEAQMRRYGKPVSGFYVLTSEDDRALSLSRMIAGNQPRVGGYMDTYDLASYGVTVLDVSGVASDGTGLNHTKFARSPLLVRLLGASLADDARERADTTEIKRRIGAITGGLGQTIGNAAGIIITTPFEVLNAVTR